MSNRGHLYGIVSALANKLMVRATNYFDTQVRIPSNSDTATHIQQLGLEGESYMNGVMHIPELPSRKMTDEQIISWYTKILDSVRLRYRKLQRFTKCVRTFALIMSFHSLDSNAL